MTILIVDDQEVVLQSIVQSVDWKNLLIDSVLTAAGAEQAKKILSSEKVDILLSDIEMPGEDGIELLKWVRQQGLQLEHIFLTSHADFSYAHEALRLGSTDYVLQPAKPSEIEAAIRKVSKNIFQKEHVRQLELHKEDILFGYIDKALHQKDFRVTEEQLRQAFERNIRNGVYYAALMSIQHWEGEPWRQDLLLFVFRNVLNEIYRTGEKCDMILCSFSNEIYYFIVYADPQVLDAYEHLEKLSRFQQFIEEYARFDMSLYYSAAETSENLLACTTRLMQLHENNVIKKTGLIAENEDRAGNAADSNDHEVGLPAAKWREWLSNGDGKLILADVNRCIMEIRTTRPVNRNDLSRIFSTFLGTWYSVCNEKKINCNLDSKTYSMEDRLKAVRNIDTLREALTYCIEQLNNSMNSEFGKGDFYRRAIDFIDDNLYRNFSRAEVAEYVNMSEVYFSRMFRERCGKTFQQHVMDERMRYAKDMLRSTSLPVSMIASRLGYDNFSYFSKVFHKETGQSPQEYRTGGQN